MSKREKAKQLVNKFQAEVYESVFTTPELTAIRLENAKQCAKICVQDQIDSIAHWGNVQDYIKFLQEVKREINIL